jgi:glutathione S-transferase
MTDFFTLYGGAISLYTGKARAYLRYRNVPYVEQPINAKVMQKIGYFMIPVLGTPEGELVQDTTEIIDYLENRFEGPSIYPEDPAQKLAALLIEVYGDEWLVIPAMHYRWKHNRDFILMEFGRGTAPDASPAEQYAAGEKVSAPFSGSLPLLGITPETEPAIETWYEEMLTQLNTHLANREYLFGSRPSIGDYGLMGPLYAHNYRDPWSGDLMRRIAPNVARWVGMMNTPQPNSGHFEPNLDESLKPVLTQIFAECVPAIVSTCEKLADWIDVHPGEDIPRSIGTHEVSIGGVRADRNIVTFNQWMFQRPLAYY